MEKALFTLSLAIFISTLGLTIISPLMSIYAESLGATGFWIGMVFSAFSISRLVFMPFIGKISDRSGRRKFILVGMLLYTLISLGYAWSSDLASLLTIRLFHGLASAMVFPIAMAYAGEISKAGWEGRTMGTYNTALFLGMASGPILGGFLSHTYNMQAAFYGMTLLSFVSLVFIFLFLPESRNIRKERISLRTMMKNNVVRGLAMMRFVRAFGRGLMMSFVPIYAFMLNLTTSEIGIIISAELFLAALLQRKFGKLSDAHSRRGLVAVGSLVTAAALILIPFSKSFFELLLLAMVMGAGDSLVMSSLSAMTISAGRTFGMGSTSGIFNSAMSAGLVVSPLLAGFLMDSVGLGYAFYFGGLMSVAGIFAFNWMVK